ncbi:xylose isomerase-like protein [Aspergillus aurantiobrunneus]
MPKETTPIPLSYATCSLATPTTPLPSKLSALSTAGFVGIELAFPDLLSYASTLHNRSLPPNAYAELRTAALEVKQLCKTHGLAIMMLQPFSNFEGWPRGSPEREEAFTRARGWIGIMEALGTDLLQVGSSDTPLVKLQGSGSGRSGLREAVIEDLRELAGLLAEKKMRMAYENWCWSSHAPGWKDVWEIVSDVRRDNVGLCLDTFQSAGGEWGDPTTISGRIGGVVSGSDGEKELNRVFERSMEELARAVPKEKIYLLQVSDAYVPVDSASRKPRPIEGRVVDGTAPRGRWSHDFRPMPYDGGYLPIEAVGRAVLKTGFRGWFSMEIFDGGEDGGGKEYDLGEFAGRARGSMGKFIEKCCEGV